MNDDKLDTWLNQAVGEEVSGEGFKKGKEIKKQSFFQKKFPFSKKPFIKRQGIKKLISKNFMKKGLKGVVRVVALGGLEEVGKNMTIFEYLPDGKNVQDIVILDMGFQFPEEDMLGIDYVIPDITYLDDKLDKIRGIVITHGHLDHIGGIPYLFPKLGHVPFYATKLTIGLIQKRLEEFGYLKQAKLNTVDPDDILKMGGFEISFFRVNHSIPDGVGVVFKTPAGIVVHSGDFKFDFNPADKKQAEIAKIAALGNQNVLALFSDSTNALKPGYTTSESKIGETLDVLIKDAPGRILIASFSSLIGRIQQIIDSAIIHNRKIFVSGRSMVDNIEMAKKLGYLNVAPGVIRQIKKNTSLPDKEVLILTTGSQGESVSALTRMAINDHHHVKIKKGDTVILSSSPIIGNEKSITTVINNLCRLGAKVISNQIMDVHTSGHAQQEDLKLMINLVKPKYLIPVHGELYMRMAHKEVAESIGIKSSNVVLLDNGEALDISEKGVNKPKIKIVTNYIMVDGLGVGDVGNQVLMDRQIMAKNGALIVLLSVSRNEKRLINIDIVSRGFIYMNNSQDIINGIKKEVIKAFKEIKEKDDKAKRVDVKNYIRGRVDKFVHKMLERHPLILPVLTIVEK